MKYATETKRKRNEVMRRIYAILLSEAATDG